MSDDAKLQKKYHVAKGRVARWEAWAMELRDGRDADVYLENREDVIREMVSGWRAMCHIPLIQRPPQLQAHSGAKGIPNRGNTMIDFVAATYHAQGDNAKFSWNRYRKVIDFAVKKVEELEAARKAKDASEGGGSGPPVRVGVSIT